ncbi:hypothetical protein ACI48J_16235 [Paenibacillus chitinolyticus]|uniref:hypothetical protein n=1 Tax=Paenibacillus chitinolyticus TaxID=79263 RepID=UPI00386E6D23
MPRLSRKSSPPAACPQCSGKKYISFNWARFQHGHDAESKQVQRALKIERQLKHGWEYACENCGSRWYLGRDGIMMSYIHPSKAGLVEHWNAGTYEVSGEIWDELKKIGASAQGSIAGGRTSAEVPCRVTTVRGETFDMAYVSFQSRPPIDLWQDGRRIRFCDEVASVEPSPYTLPADVRLATSWAQEIRMGYAPTAVQAPDGHLFQLNWANDFFASGPYKGEDLRLTDLAGDWDQADMAGVPSEYILYFVADWRADLDSLYLDAAGSRASKQISAAPEEDENRDASAEDDSGRLEQADGTEERD